MLYINFNMHTTTCLLTKGYIVSLLWSRLFCESGCNTDDHTDRNRNFGFVAAMLFVTGLCKIPDPVDNTRVTLNPI